MKSDGRRILKIFLDCPCIPGFKLGCSRKADVDFSSDRPFLPSELGKALDTIGTPALEEWVEANPGDIEALNVLYGRYAMAESMKN